MSNGALWQTPLGAPWWSPTSEWRDVAATLGTLGLCVLWMLTLKGLVRHGALDSRLSRKVMHIFTGPIFLLCWNLFSSLPAARFAAAFVPLTFTLQFGLIGLGVVADPETVASMSRSGSPRELLLGPLVYGLTFIVATVAFWRHSPIGIIALMTLCGGDGLAEVVGKRLGSSPESKLPWAPAKSWPGSIAMFLGSLVFSLVFVSFFNWCGNFQPPVSSLPLLLVLVVIALAAALAESVAPEHWDNVIVPLVTVVLGELMLPLMQTPRGHQVRLERA